MIFNSLKKLPYLKMSVNTVTDFNLILKCLGLGYFCDASY